MLYQKTYNHIICILKISKFYLSLLLVLYLMHPSSVLCAKLLQSCPTLCDTTDCSLPASSVHGTLQARILEWVAKPSSGDLPDPGIEPTSLVSPALAGGFFTTSGTLETSFNQS